jgi:hypothetical protein
MEFQGKNITVSQPNSSFPDAFFMLFATGTFRFKPISLAARVFQPVYLATLPTYPVFHRKITQKRWNKLTRKLL